MVREVDKVSFFDRRRYAHPIRFMNQNQIEQIKSLSSSHLDSAPLPFPSILLSPTHQWTASLLSFLFILFIF